MPQNDNEIGGKVGLDVSDFKAGISELNRQIKVIDSGFKAAAAGMGDWGKNADGLSNRIESLTKITELQRQKIENLNEIYKKTAEEKGENSKAAQNLQIQINKETESLNKNLLEIERNTKSLNDFGDEEQDAEKKTSSLTGTLDKLGSGLAKAGGTVAKAAAVGVAAVGTASVAAAAGAFELAKSVGETADDLLTMSAKTGIS